MNPILPMKWMIPDGEAHVSGGRLYLYGSCDRAGDHYCSGEYYVASTGDMEHWEVDGPSLRVEDIPWQGDAVVHPSMVGVKCFDDLPYHIKKMLPDYARSIPIEQIIRSVGEASAKNLPKGTFLYAPDAAQKNGKTYLYLCLSDDSEGVAVSESTTGPFEGAMQLSMDQSKAPVTGIDPAVFVDCDGQAYYYWGQFQAKAAELNDDMCTLKENTVSVNILTEKEHHFHEGSCVRRINDTYYYIFTDISRGKPTCLGYATGSSPLGPFTYRGVIIDNAGCDPGAWNNHGSIAKFHGQWYVFYHRSFGNSCYFRRACAEIITIDEDGNIAEVKPTSSGVGAPFCPGDVIPAYTACEVKGGAYICENKDPDTNALVFPVSDSGAVFRYFENSECCTEFTFKAKGRGILKLYDEDQMAGSGSTDATSFAIRLRPALHELRVSYEGSGGAMLYEFRIR